MSAQHVLGIFHDSLLKRLAALGRNCSIGAIHFIFIANLCGVNTRLVSVVFLGGELQGWLAKIMVDPQTIGLAI